MVTCEDSSLECMNFTSDLVQLVISGNDSETFGGNKVLAAVIGGEVHIVLGIPIHDGESGIRSIIIHYECYEWCFLDYGD